MYVQNITFNTLKMVITRARCSLFIQICFNSKKHGNITNVYRARKGLTQLRVSLLDATRPLLCRSPWVTNRFLGETHLDLRAVEYLHFSRETSSLLLTWLLCIGLGDGGEGGFDFLPFPRGLAHGGRVAHEAGR